MPHALQHTVFKTMKPSLLNKKDDTTFIARIKNFSLRVHIHQGQCYGIANESVKYCILVHKLEKMKFNLFFYEKTAAVCTDTHNCMFIRL
jgi:hypothetical protein